MDEQIHSRFLSSIWINKNVKIKVSESSAPRIITDDVDLETMFWGNPLLKDTLKDWVSIAHKCCVSCIYVLYVYIYAIYMLYIYTYIYILYICVCVCVYVCVLFAIYNCCYICLTKQSQTFMKGLLQFHLSFLTLWWLCGNYFMT